VAAGQNKALVRQFLERLDADRRVIDEACDSRFVAHLPGSTPEVGREGFAQFVSMFYLAFPDLSHKVEDQVAEGDMVVSRLTVQGTHQGPFQGLAPTGKQVTFTDILITRIGNQKMVELWAQLDALGLLGQLGLSPFMTSG
jgi:predicted ester cyclase